MKQEQNHIIPPLCTDRRFQEPQVFSSFSVLQVCHQMILLYPKLTDLTTRTRINAEYFSLTSEDEGFSLLFVKINNSNSLENYQLFTLAR
jgi:hypothetical protein